MKSVYLFLVFGVFLSMNAYAVFYGISDTNGLTQYSNTGTQTSLAAIDGRALALDQTNSHLYLGTLTGVVRTDLNGNNATTIISEGSPIGGVAIDVANERIYYTVDNPSGTSDEIKRINFDGTGELLLSFSTTTFAVTRQIAVDVVEEKIYWAQGVDSGSGGFIRKANVDAFGSGTENFHSGSNPYGVAVNAYEPKFYGSLVQSGTVFKADIDGTNDVDLESALLGVRSLSGDYANDLIYYVYGFGSNLGRVGTDGTGEQLVFSLAANTHQVVGDFAPIPEPSTYALVLGLTSLVFFVWKRRKRQKKTT